MVNRKSKTSTTSASNASHRGSQSSDMNTECSTNTATTNNDGNKQFAQRWMKSKSSLSTSTVMDGTVGEWEFFARSTYPYCALSSTDSIVLEIDYGSFWSILGEFYSTLVASFLNK